jgi:Tol biopolymer transport system component
VGRYAISPDGVVIAYVAEDTAGASSIWLRRLDSLVTRQLPGTRGAQMPFWSPDGRSLAFFSDAKLKRIDSKGGLATVICDASDSPGGGAWLSGGEIVFSRGGGALWRVSAKGGTPAPATILDTARSELTHLYPQALPDGRHFLYMGVGFRAGASAIGTFVASLDGGPPKYISPYFVRFAAPHHALVGTATGAIAAVDFDVKSLALRGDPVSVVAQSVQDFAVSNTGVMVYKTTESFAARTSLTMLDRTGRTVKDLGPLTDDPVNDYYSPRISPNGRYVAFEHHLPGGTQDLYAIDLTSGNSLRETFDPKNHSAFVAWAPDSKQLAYGSTKSGGGDVYLKSLDSPVDRRLVPTAPMPTMPSDWSSDGKLLLFDRASPRTGNDVWVMPIAGGAPTALLATPANEMQATFSPDGKWIAYASDEENGRYEVFVRPYPTTGQQWKVSANGGEAPRWRRDGKELFFLIPPDRGGGIMSAKIDAGASFRSETPTRLFAQPIRVLGGFLRSGVEYDVAPDGQSFIAVVMHPRVAREVPTLDVFVNWMSALAR